MAEPETFDYVVVGAGSAGCVLASRLSEDAHVRVLLLEAGPVDHPWAWQLHMPAALAYPLKNQRYNWGYWSEPEPHMDGRRIYCPRGRVLGGSSSINGMAYVRGHARDYDRWAQSGLRGWDYAHVLPYFKRAETRAQGGDRLPRRQRAPARRHRRLSQPPLWGVHRGGPPGRLSAYRRHERLPAGGFRAHGHDGARRPALERRARVSRSGAAPPEPPRAHRRADLPRTLRRRPCRRRRLPQERATVSVRAGREVILAGGAINSPQLLMLSGIGDADELASFDIPVVAHLPGVGRNLQDHLEIYVQHACTRPISLYAAQKPWNKLRIGLEWILLKRGLGATSHFEAGAFIRSRAGVEHPDLQYHFLPIAMNYDGSNPQQTHGFQAHVGPMRPTSVGRVRLRSADPKEPPSILFNYMATEGDRQEMRAAVRLTREIFAQRAFDPYLGPELAPGAEVGTDAEIDAFVRARAESAYHACGTCKMGLDSDPSAVVDGNCRVYGIEALRVVDASIMPSIVSGNPTRPRSCSPRRRPT